MATKKKAKRPAPKKAVKKTGPKRLGVAVSEGVLIQLRRYQKRLDSEFGGHVSQSRAIGIALGQAQRKRAAR